MRIFPEMCVRTLCPLSNSTRNMAFGRGSTTVPSTSMASFFAKAPGIPLDMPKDAPGWCPERTASIGGRGEDRLPAVSGGQDLVAVLGDRDRVLEVRGEALVGGDHRPPVGEEPGAPRPHVDHRFDGHHQPRPDQRASSRLAVVRHLWILVESPAHPVAGVFADAAE